MALIRDSDIRARARQLAQSEYRSILESLVHMLPRAWGSGDKPNRIDNAPTFALGRKLIFL
jgi:hypothetical protein